MIRQPLVKSGDTFDGRVESDRRQRSDWGCLRIV